MMVWRFRRLIEAYGADPARWPPPERAAALALLATSAQARAALEDARRLDALLAADRRPAPDASLAESIIARAAAQPQERPARSDRRLEPGGWSLPRLWPQAAGLLAAALLGFAVGWANLLPSAFGGDETVDLSDYVAGGAGAEEPLP
jgi:hypothetical protein